MQNDAAETHGTDAEQHGDVKNADVASALRQVHRDFVERGVDRTDADLALLEANGMMISRTLADDDDFFGLESLEPGETVYEFTKVGLTALSSLTKDRTDG